MTLVPSLGALLLLGCCVQLGCFIVFYLVMFVCHLVEACSSLMRDRKEEGLRDRGRGGGEELGEVETGEITTRICYMRKKTLFSTKQKHEKISVSFVYPKMVLSCCRTKDGFNFWSSTFTSPILGLQACTTIHEVLVIKPRLLFR